MNSYEHDEWSRAVKEANRLGRLGVRVKSVTMVSPTTATGMPLCVFTTDIGPMTATEAW